MQQVVFTVLAAAALVHAQPPSDWDTAYSKAEAALEKLSLDEKVGIVTGVKWTGGPCVGNTYAPTSIDYPSLCLQDGPLGFRFAQPVTAHPAGINAGATWDRALINERGAAFGAEGKGLGIHVQLGPVAGPLGKIAAGGRNWEGFAADPYLSGIAMIETINGIQAAGVQACAKHYIGNEQERNRETMSSNIDDRTLHELYLWPFADAVKANVASVMCSYNKVNGSWACESDALQNKILKTELGFKGYILSDWNAQHTTVNSAISGLDMTMPGSDFANPPGSIFWGSNLAAAVTNGTVPESRVDDMVVRVLAGWYLLGQDDGNYPSVKFSSWNGGNASVDVTADHKNIARAVARDSIVLLKNVNNTLPLSKPRSLAIVGSDAIVNPQGPNACGDRGCNTNHLAMGWGSGTAEFPYLIAPLDAIKVQAAADGTNITTSTTDVASDGAAAAANADIALVFITSDSGEGYITVEGHAGDRNHLDPWHDGNELVKAVAAVNKKTVVVVHSVGPVILETILAQPNVVAVVWAGLPGQESGNALVDVLYGSTSPSGKLPYTIAQQTSDYGAVVLPGDDDFTDGLFIDYRHFDQNGITPRYEFGYGLSYTTFDYSHLRIKVHASQGPATGEVVPGGPEDLFESVGTITATVTNNGTVTGAEVAQLYIGYPSSAPTTPPKQLRGFDKLKLEADASDTATFDIRRRDISYWDVSQQQWVVPTGTFNVYVGSSSRDIRLTGTFRVGGY